MKWNENTESLEFEEFGDGSVEIQPRHKIMYVAAVNRELKKWFDAQSRMYTCSDALVPELWAQRERWDKATHKAILIGVTKIKEETAESLLEEIIALANRPGCFFADPSDWALIERAKRILERK